MLASRYNHVILAIFYSFFSKKFYHHALKHWHKKYLSYFLVVIIILVTLFTIRMTINTQRFIKTFAAEVMATMPTLEFKQGQLVSSHTKPYFVTPPRIPVAIAVIDANGQYKNFSKDSAILLMTKDKYYLKLNAQDIRSYAYDTKDSFVFGPAQLKELFDKNFHTTVAIFYILLWLICFVILFIFYSLYIALLSIFTSTFASACSVKFNYRFYLKLSCLAATLPSLYFAIIYLFHWVNVDTVLIYFFLQIIYLIMAVVFVKDITNKNSIKINDK